MKKALKKNLITCSIFLLSVSGCSDIKGERTSAGNSPENELSMVDSSPADSEVFNFEAPELYSGSAYLGSDLYQNSPSLVTFVVPSCPICVEEGPKLANAAENNPDINYVLVHSFGDKENYIEYVESAGLIHENIVHLSDTDGLLWKQFGVTAQPSTVLVNSNGEISLSTGALGDDGLIRAADQILK